MTNWVCGGGNITRFLSFRGRDAILRPFHIEQMGAYIKAYSYKN